MKLNEAIDRMMVCAPVTGWCPRENECFLVASTLQDYRKTMDFTQNTHEFVSVSDDAFEQLDEEIDVVIEHYAPDVGFFLKQKPTFEFE